MELSQTEEKKSVCRGTGGEKLQRRSERRCQNDKQTLKVPATSHNWSCAGINMAARHCHRTQVFRDREILPGYE